MNPSLIMLILYFGRWPEWIDLFVESCKWNPSVRWLLYTDCGEPENKADNVDYVHLSFDDYKAKKPGDDRLPHHRADAQHPHFLSR